jgi:hypothetical protein
MNFSPYIPHTCRKLFSGNTPRVPSGKRLKSPRSERKREKELLSTFPPHGIRRRRFLLETLALYMVLYQERPQYMWISRWIEGGGPVDNSPAEKKETKEFFPFLRIAGTMLRRDIFFQPCKPYGSTHNPFFSTKHTPVEGGLRTSPACAR